MARDTRLNALLLLLFAFTSTCSAAPTVQGCYSNSAPLVFQGSSDNQSTANCNSVCIATSNNRLVLGLSNGTECWCGSELPKASARGSSVDCDTPCSGDSDYICGGGTEYLTVWLTELGTEEGDVPVFTGSSTTTSAASTRTGSTASTGTGTGNNSPTSSGDNNSPTSTGNNNSPTSTGNNNSPTSTGNNNSPTNSGNNNSPTGTQTNGNSPNTASSGASKGTATAGEAASGNGAQKTSSNQGSDKDVAIAVGVVIGVVALALLGFIFWWVSRRRRQTGSYSRYRDSVDGSSAALQQNPAKMPSPESSGYGVSSAYGVSNGPEMAESTRDNGAYGPSIRVQQPTPGPGSPTDSVYSESIAAVAAPAAIAAPAAAALAPSREPSLRPPPSPQGSRASSTTDPYYTPLEQPSITHLNSTELASVKAQTPRSSSEWSEENDELSPLENIGGPQRQGSRHLPYAYSSEEDFADGNRSDQYTQSPIMPGNMPGYFPVGRNWGGRIEMP